MQKARTYPLASADADDNGYGDVFVGTVSPVVALIPAAIVLAVSAILLLALI
jgi:hypothetical protein